MINQQVSAEVAMLRQKAANNELTLEDTRRAIELLQTLRGKAGTTSAASKAAKAKKGPVDSDKLLDELEGL